MEIAVQRIKDAGGKLVRGKWEVEGDLNLSSLNLTKLPPMGEVGGYFYCDNNQLTSLKGAPKEVGGDFYCYSNQLTSLAGAPEEVGGGFYCYSNQLTSLEGAPKEVGGYFYCYCNQLTSLEGAPEKVGGNFYCGNNQLTSLEGAPKKVGGDFCCYNNQLTSLEGAPEKVGGDFSCSYNQLTSLEGAPKKVGGDFYCRDNPLPRGTTYEGWLARPAIKEGKAHTAQWAKVKTPFWLDACYPRGKVLIRYEREITDHLSACVGRLQHEGKGYVFLSEKADQGVNQLAGRMFIGIPRHRQGKVGSPQWLEHANLTISELLYAKRRNIQQEREKMDKYDAKLALAQAATASPRKENS